VNAALKIRLRIKGRSTIKGIPPLKYMYATYPKEIPMMVYNTLHTGPNNQEGGAHSGFISVWYQLYVSFMV